jgi:hypothetical protein
MFLINGKAWRRLKSPYFPTEKERTKRVKLTRKRGRKRKKTDEKKALQARQVTGG